MASIERTAYPRFSRVFTSRELQDVLAPACSQQRRPAPFFGSTEMFSAPAIFPSIARHTLHVPPIVPLLRLEVPCKSDTPRGAGGLMGWTASKAVDYEFRRRAEARLC
jgi:hypothetical protein